MALAKNPMGRRVLETMVRKRSNLAVAADVEKADDVLKLADAIGPYICCLKTHCDIHTDWNTDARDGHGARLVELSKKHDFVIFEDRKFADIGNTVVMQYRDGLHRIAEWSDVTNAHLVPGPGIIQGLKSAGGGKGCLLLAEMSSQGTLAKGTYVKGLEG